MARQIHEADDPHGDKRALLNKKARELAKRKGWDLKRALTVLEETAWEARKYLERGRVRELFERESPERLLFRVDFTPHLLGGKLPLYSLEELEELTEAFIGHLQKNRGELIRTGYTWNRFRASYFLDWRLNRLYFTELPVKRTKPDARIRDVLDRLWKVEHPDQELPKRWIGRKAPLDVNLFENIVQAEKTKGSSKLGIPDLAEGDARKLKAARETLFDLKIRILEALLEALKRRSSQGLWDRCLDLVSEALTADQVETLLRLDRHYMSFDASSGQVMPGSLSTPAGGMSELWLIISHYEEELERGPWSGLREALGDLCKNGRLVVPQIAYEDYFNLLKIPEQKTIDSAMTAFLSNPPRSRVYWNSFCVRVDEALKNKLPVEVKMVFRRPRGVDREHGASLDAQHKILEMYASSTGDLVAFSVDTPTKTEDKYVFRLSPNGRVWEVIFEGKHSPLPDQLGLRYIHYVLRHPWKKISPSELVQEYRKPPALGDDSAQIQIKSGQVQEEGLEDDNSDWEVGDEIYRRQVEAELRKLNRRHIEAKKKSNLDEMKRIDKDRKELRRYRSQLVDVHGKGRRRGSASDRDRSSATNAINKVRMVLRKDNEPLWSHFKAYLHTGTEFHYAPPKDMPWEWVLE